MAQNWSPHAKIDTHEYWIHDLEKSLWWVFRQMSASNVQLLSSMARALADLGYVHLYAVLCVVKWKPLFDYRIIRRRSMLSPSHSRPFPLILTRTTESDRQRVWVNNLEQIAFIAWSGTLLESVWLLLISMVFVSHRLVRQFQSWLQSSFSMKADRLHCLVNVKHLRLLFSLAMLRCGPPITTWCHLTADRNRDRTPSFQCCYRDLIAIWFDLDRFANNYRSAIPRWQFVFVWPLITNKIAWPDSDSAGMCMASPSCLLPNPCYSKSVCQYCCCENLPGMIHLVSVVVSINVGGKHPV